MQRAAVHISSASLLVLPSDMADPLGPVRRA